MKQLLTGVIIMSIALSSCAPKDSAGSANPLQQDFTAYKGAAPFDVIKEEHYLPAFEKAMADHKAEVQAIIDNPATPTFDNTVKALEKTGADLDRISNAFFVVYGANTNDSLQAIARTLMPKLTEHGNSISLNDSLFQRIKYVAEHFNPDEHITEEVTLVNKYMEDFVRSGADLPEEKKERIREINTRMSSLDLAFDEHIRNENKKLTLILDESDLDGLPDDIRTAAAEKADQSGHPGKYVFTIQRSSMYPFLTYSTRRDLREKLYRAYVMKGDNNDENDNKDIVLEIAALRLEQARLFGYETYADYQLANKMSARPDNVYKLLDELWAPALKIAEEEARLQQELVDAEGHDFELAPWDWWYYTEKLRQKTFDFSDEDIKPYFELNRVRDGAFEVVRRLYGVHFEEIENVPVWHPDVRVFEVKNSDGKHVGLFYTDYYTRDSKGMGAWMTSVRKQSNIDEYVTPLIVNVCNFPPPTKDMPSLLTLDQVNTLFHELGHGLHGLLSDSHYPRLTGTSVVRDFVELPSQIMENWILEPEALKIFAKHYKTGEDLPQVLLDKILAAARFNQGFKTVEYLAASYLDLDWHSLKEFNVEDVNAFEQASMDRIGLIDEIYPRYRSTYFGHTFSGGYSAGYYSYIWAEVLDADAFMAFKESGDIFNPSIAASFRENILARGGSDDPMVLYKRFRGRAPQIDALLEKRGLN